MVRTDGQTDRVSESSYGNMSAQKISTQNSKLVVSCRSLYASPEDPISRPCTFPPAHWWLILLINDFSLVIGGKLHSEYLGFSLLETNYSKLATFPFFFPGGPVAARLQTHTLCSRLNSLPVWHRSRQMKRSEFSKVARQESDFYFLLCNYIGLFLPVAILESDRLFKHAQSLQLAGDKGHAILPGLYSLNIPSNSLYNASYYMCRKITSHWQPLFSKKMAAAASFSYKIGGDGLIFL